MNTVLALIILLRSNTLKQDTTFMISDCILRNIDIMESMSIKELAKQSFVSTTSIIKYIELLGFNSYPDFRRHLVNTCNIRRLQLSEKHQLLSVDELLEKIECFSDQFKRDVFMATMNKVVDIIIESKEIHLYGAVFPMNLLQSFTEDMAVIGVKTFVNQTTYNDMIIKKENGLNVMISLTGRSLETHASDYSKFCEVNEHTLLISHQSQNIGNVEYHFEIPHTISTDYDDIIFLLMLDIMKLLYYKRLNF